MKKILVVDDEYAFCKALKKFLEDRGFLVHIVTNGEHALDILQEESHHLMTLDIRMPGIDGYQVLERAKRIAHDLKIVVVSAIERPGMEEKLERVGASAVLHKPVDLKELLSTINLLLN